MIILPQKLLANRGSCVDNNTAASETETLLEAEARAMAAAVRTDQNSAVCSVARHNIIRNAIKVWKFTHGVKVLACSLLLLLEFLLVSVIYMLCFYRLKPKLV
jgi:hypothetical protein